MEIVNAHVKINKIDNYISNIISAFNLFFINNKLICIRNKKYS